MALLTILIRLRRRREKTRWRWWVKPWFGRRVLFEQHQTSMTDVRDNAKEIFKYRFFCARRVAENSFDIFVN